MNSNNLFAGLKDAKVSERGVFLNPGQYLVKVRKCQLKRTRKNFDAFILDFHIEKSNYEEQKKAILLGVTSGDVNLELEKSLPNKAGTNAGWFQSLQDKDVGWGSLKGFAASIMGITNLEDPDFNNEVETFLSSCASSSQVLTGKLIPVEVRHIKTRAGKDFSLHTWSKIVEP